MRKQSKATRVVFACAASLSLLLSMSVSPATSASAASTSIATKTRVLTAEQKKAKSDLDAAKKDLTRKEKILKDAQAKKVKADKALADAQKVAAKLGISTSKAATSKVSASSKKVKAAKKALANAKKANAAAAALVIKHTTERDLAQAKVVKFDAAYAWLINDISDLECGVGTDVVNANGAVEHVWECGIVYMHEDGDTTHVKTTENKLIEVRNIGLQTPEMKKGKQAAQCGAKPAFDNFKTLMPEEVTVVQLRSISKSTNGWGGHNRPIRSVYKLNDVTGEFDIDVQAEQIKAGWSFWWPIFAEWTHNAEYLDLVNEAKANKVGIWNPSLCGSDKGKTPQMWVNTEAPNIGSDYESAFGEYVVLNNPSEVAMDISGWSLRDQSLNFFWDAQNSVWKQDRNKFPKGTVIPAGGYITFYLDNPKNYPLNKSTEREYFTWAFGDGKSQLSNSYVKPPKINGEGVYLLDTKGNVRRSFITPCGTSKSGFAACTAPTWFKALVTETATQIIPVPVALNRVANTIYNPIVKLTRGKIRYVDDQGDNVSIATGGKFIDGGVSETKIDGKQAADTVLGFSTSRNGTILTNSRVAIADKTGTTRTTIYTRVASGFNTVPNLDGLTQAQAETALTAAGFKLGTVTEVPDGTLGAIAVDSQSLVGRQAVRLSIDVSIHTGVK
jgi:endonuclease YncB( thermonuclease family)